MDDQKSQLCVCLTPLHVQIASRIAATRRTTFDHAVYIAGADGPKQRHYYQKMSEFCRSSVFLVLPEGSNYKRPKHLSIWLARLRALALFKKLGSFDTVYVPSSVSQNVYAILSAVAFRELVTYDDGLLNVLPAAPAAFVHTRWSTKAFFLASGLRYWPERIRAAAKVHYSIYDAPNACAPVERIRLFAETGEADQSSTQPADAGRAISLFLGPYPEADERIWAVVNAKISQLEVSGYLPHPRERVKMARGVAYIDTQHTAEDYVFALKSLHPGCRIDVYGYDSAALANLAGTPHVCCYSLLGSADGNADLMALFTRLGVNVV